MVATITYNQPVEIFLWYPGKFRVPSTLSDALSRRWWWWWNRLCHKKRVYMYNIILPLFEMRALSCKSLSNVYTVCTCRVKRREMNWHTNHHHEHFQQWIITCDVICTLDAASTKILHVHVYTRTCTYEQNNVRTLGKNNIPFAFNWQAVWGSSILY